MMSRRQFITISAAAAGYSLIGAGAAAASSPQIVTWRGTALGASASLVIHHSDQVAAERLVRQILVEVEKLEQCSASTVLIPGSRS